MKPSSEPSLYQDGNDLITETRAVLAGQAFDLADISSVSLTPPVLRQEYGYISIGLGLLLALVGYLVWGVFLTPMLVGVVLVIAGVALLTVVRQSYIVSLNRTNGQAATILFPDRARAERVVAALSGALSRRR